MCAPILCDGVVVGVINATNKCVRGKPRGPSEEEDSDLTFSADDRNLLGFIATNAGLALKQSQHHNSIPKLISMDADKKQNLGSLIDTVYNVLCAERVSIFKYSPSSHALICTVSQDIEGFTMPPDKGFAGLSFTTLKTVNVADAKQDDRHNKEVDNTVGFTTRSVLCAPILQDGIAVGVIQAINKTTGTHFTSLDEEQISDLCNLLSPLLLKDNGDRPRRHSDFDKSPFIHNSVNNNNASNNSSGSSGGGGGEGFSRLFFGMLAANSLEELLDETEKVVFKISQCDTVRVYALDRSSLYRVRRLEEVQQVKSSGPKAGLNKDHSSEMHYDQYLTMSDVSLEVKNALQSKSPIEFAVPKGSTQPQFVVPDFKAYQAMIFPMTSRAYSYEPGTCILIVGNAKNDLPIAPAVKEKLDIVHEYFNRALGSIHDRFHQEDCLRTIKSNFNLLNNTLGVLKDYVILLNSEGNLVACNRMLDDLVGRDSLRQDRSRMSSPTHGGGEHHSAFDGLHYTEWLGPGNSPELVRDIANALTSKKSRSQDEAKFISPVHKSGVKMNYQVIYIENPDLVDTTASTSSLPGLVSPRSPRGDMESTSTFAVVVIIQIQGERISRHAGGFLATLEMPQLVHKSHSAHEVVNAATSILDNVRSSFILEPTIQESLKTIQKSLSDTSRLMSLQNSGHSAVNEALDSVECPLVSPSITLPKNWSDWEFDVTEYKDSIMLCSIIGNFFVQMFDFNELKVDTSTLAKYIIEVGKNYHDRPFHNLQHSACVTHFCFKLMNETKAKEHLNLYQLFGILLSAVVHDVDHPGNTNLFEINSSSELALIYNDQSVLENHHCSTAFRLMRKPGLQLLTTLPKDKAVEIRKVIISCVMATDMAVHFELIDETKKRAQDGWNFEEAKDQALLGKILLHAADLSNPVRPFHMTRKWAERISNEFNDQVSREEALGMPVLGFMKTPDEKAFCKNETGFAGFVVAPMWRAMALVYPALNFLVQQLDSNLQTWKSTLEEVVAAEKRAAEQESKQNS